MSDAAETPAPQKSPVELAEVLASHPDHAGCCPKCRQATAEAWAFSRQTAWDMHQVAEFLGKLDRGEISVADITGLGRRARKRRRRGGGDEAPAVPAEVAEGSVQAAEPEYVEPTRRRPFVGEVPTEELTPVHSHSQGWAHAHLGGEVPHVHPGLAEEDYVTPGATAAILELNGEIGAQAETSER